MSDIAFDDVSILTDQDCASNENDDDNDDGNDTKDSIEGREDEDGGILNVESCINRCFEDVNATVSLYANKTLSCSCSIDCDVKTTCCPDFLGKLTRKILKISSHVFVSKLNANLSLAFLDICMNDSSQQNMTTSITMTTSRLTTALPETTTQMTTMKRTSTTTKRISNLTTSTSPKTTTTSTTRTRISTSTTPTTSMQTSTPKVISTMKTEAPTPQDANNNRKEEEDESDYEEISSKNSNEIEDEHDIVPEEMQQLVNEKAQSKNFSIILTTLVIVVVSLILASIAIIIVYKQYRKSTNPLNYKEKSECATSRADEEFSEIRYLTSDETLDFSLATPDNATDL